MVEGLVYQFVYKLERHRLFEISLQRWFVFLCLILPATAWLRFWGASYLAALLVTLGAAAVLVVMWWARRQRYVRFWEDIHSQASKNPSEEQGVRLGAANRKPTAFPLPPMSKTRVYATGFFEVSGKRRYLVDTPADFTTFETHEHCVMTRVPHSRFLLLGTSDQAEVGWWYTFFQPAMLQSIRNGWLRFGLRPRPSLRLEIALPEGSQDEILYLSFGDTATRSLVLADLQYDADLS